MSIVVENITKIYGEQKALNAVSFRVAKGEIVGFLGPNGAGKSTMMKILTTYLKATSGNAVVNEFDTIANARNVQKSVGYLPEHNPLYLDMHVREYLAFSANVHKVAKSRIDEVIKMTGLSPEAHKKISELSKGYRQRVGLANALLHDPEVLILDEPTTGLDPNQLTEIRNLITSIGKEKTIFLSTHIMQEVEAICDRVIIINKGEIVADTTLAKLQKDQQQVIEVEFDYRIEDVLLEQIPHVTQVVNTHGLVYELTFDTTKDMRSTVFDFAHDNELKALQINPKNKNLESLFRELTAS
ncbi:gliding motility-associated ABC transporter ATP-binding subunit GldA [Kordia sp. YSTF-M3]|uniref:Gliding motility-associated ABC transporter ATP-binding subunit GldA n=1 Tax=Kordia aestuariivivens TaxID=2759037 RepID=A0ABR7Q413_9FLAO|nr:gliding motility-associated ABC transporter ATP-binding subunit GldA [Kordia aestuariivivens]MBC8753287.1 gliding motility-associated ABC transporter ATP-binding subunit GldA [Kordia aestuariivivens]